MADAGSFYFLLILRRSLAFFHLTDASLHAVVTSEPCPKAANTPSQRQGRAVPSCQLLDGEAIDASVKRSRQADCQWQLNRRCDSDLL